MFCLIVICLYLHMYIFSFTTSNWLLSIVCTLATRDKMSLTPNRFLHFYLFIFLYSSQHTFAFRFVFDVNRTRKLNVFCFFCFYIVYFLSKHTVKHCFRIGRLFVRYIHNTNIEKTRSIWMTSCSWCWFFRAFFILFYLLCLYFQNAF